MSSDEGRGAGGERVDPADDPPQDPADAAASAQAHVGEGAPSGADPAVEDVAPGVRPAVRRVDPEDWSRSGEDDDRYLRDRPPHWE
ncbi:MAG: hypothetical protein ACKVZ6_17895 [Kineosporiaceae bacterium]|jgi:hypothetical protein